MDEDNYPEADGDFSTHLSEKRELLGNLRSRIVYKDKTLTLLAE